ncbi:MAG: 50S ribosomal protein L25 [bacterium]|nr:50S ribosomal protein L25 [bacterium]
MELSVQKREQFGRQTKALRRTGLVPAELYGRGLENLHLSVNAKEFAKVLKQAGESSIVDLLIDGEKRPVLIHDVAVHPVTDEVTNIDFYQVRLDEKITVYVPVHFMGESQAVKDGGVLVKAMQEIELEALPNNIPKALEVDLSKLTEIGQSIYIKDLSLSEDVKFFVDIETPVASVIAQVTEEEEAAMEAAATDVDAVKVESEEKKAERDAEKGVEPVATGEAEAAPAK